MSRMPGPGRILHVLVTVAATNGQYNEHCLPLARERRITICALCPSSLVPPAEITLLEGDGTVRGCLRVLRRALDRDNYEVVHAHAPASGVALLAANLLYRRSMAHSVFTMQNSFSNYRLRNRLLLVPIFAAFPAVVLCSEAVRESLPTLLRRIGGSRITVVPNAVDLQRVDRALDVAAREPGERERRTRVIGENPEGRAPAERADCGAPAESRKRFRGVQMRTGQHHGFTVVSVGRLVDMKNPFTLLSAFEQSRGDGGRLVFVGDGPLRPGLEAAAAALGPPGEVTFTGLVGRDDVYRHVATADLCVSTSYGEGMPVAVLEAMACGRPVLLSDIPPHREIARGTDVIPLVPPDDVDGFAEQIRRFRALAPAGLAAVGTACRQLVEDRYGIPAMHAALNEVYQRVTATTAKEVRS